MKRYSKTFICMLALFALVNLFAAIGSYIISKNISQTNGWILGIGQTKIALESLTANMTEVNAVAEKLDWRKNQSQELIKVSADERKKINEDFSLILQKIKDSKENKILYSSKKNYNTSYLTQNSLENLWLPLEIELLKLFQQFNNKDPALMDSLSEATKEIKKQNHSLKMGLNSLEKIHKSEAEKFSSYLVLLQLLEVFCTLCIFFYLLYLSIHQLKYRDQELLIAQKETQNIKESIGEGIFLINRNLVIGSQYSARAEEILATKKLAGQKLDKILEDMVSQQDLQMTRDFIAQVYNEEVYEDYIQELNPLDKVEVKNKNGGINYLNFKFSRVYGENDEIINVLVSLTDITKQIVLEEKLEKERKQHDEQIELLTTVLNVPDDILSSFLRHLEKSTSNINSILQQQEGMSFLAKANKIFTEVHSLKGEASSISLHHIVEIVETMENHLSNLKEKYDLQGLDFLPITIKLDKLVDLSDKIDKVRRKIIEGKKTQSLNAEQLRKQFNKFVNEIAQRQNKKIEFNLNKFDEKYLTILNNNQRDNIHSAIIQLLRNAIVHGIESEELRKSKNKPEQGRVFCKINLDDKNLIIQVGDDGAGINFEALREKAREAGFLDLDANDEATKEKLIKFMFLSGISTAKMQSEDAGRGVGMEVVKNNLDEIGATINLKTTEGEGTVWTIEMNVA